MVLVINNDGYAHNEAYSYFLYDGYRFRNGSCNADINISVTRKLPEKDLGVVTSSSQFFRQIGGTFGITILGSIMNNTSGTTLTNKLVPVLDTFPKEAGQMVTKFKDMIHTDPQGLYSMLFSPEALKQMPEAFANSIVPILKNSLVDSLHTVFLTGLVFIVVGAIFTIFLQKLDYQIVKKMLKSLLLKKKKNCIILVMKKHRLMAVLFEYNLKSF